MNQYLLNLNAQSNGDHEVHKKGCRFEPSLNVYVLGYFEDCKSAVKRAKELYSSKKINGCRHCSYTCHTS